MSKHTFLCGCSFDIIGPPPFPKSDLPAIRVDWDEIPLDCKATWDLLASGKTRMVFQLEKGGGRNGARELKPEEIEHMSALGSVLRPGCANSLDANGISTTEHYYRRKNGEEEVTSYHPALDSILGKTYNCMIYQEQSMQIAEKIAGFNKQEADQLRKSIGKKLPEEMAKVKKIFIEGAKRTGIVSEAQAEEIFSWIKESQKYNFNHSHSLCYGIIGYQCAYAKAHFPVITYTSWLRDAHNKQKPMQEVQELVNDARAMGIEVYPAAVEDKKINFYTDGETIKFGLFNLRGIGSIQAHKFIDFINEKEKTFKSIRDWSWYEFLVICGFECPKTVMESIIRTGAIRYTNVTRAKAIHEYTEVWQELKDKEQSWINEHMANWDNLKDAVKALRDHKNPDNHHDKKRIPILDGLINLLAQPITSLKDSPMDIANDEEHLMGVAITCNIVDVKPGQRWTATCKDCVTGEIPKLVILKVKIEEVKEITIKKGKEENIGRHMAFIRVSDSTCSLEDISCFPDSWENEKFQHLLIPGRTVEMQLENTYKPRKNEKNTGKKIKLNIKDIWAI